MRDRPPVIVHADVNGDRSFARIEQPDLQRSSVAEIPALLSLNPHAGPSPLYPQKHHSPFRVWPHQRIFRHDLLCGARQPVEG